MRTCEGKLCGAYICFRIFEKKNGSTPGRYSAHPPTVAHSGATMHSRQAAQSVPRCLGGAQRLFSGEVATVAYARNMPHPPPSGMIPGVVTWAGGDVIQYIYRVLVYTDIDLPGSDLHCYRSTGQ
jgi:hypothetical protein